MVKKGLILFFILFTCAFFSFQARAQVESGDIVLNVNPQYPKANENVTASLSTFTTDLNDANISWTLNGSTILEGIGKKTFSFKVGNSGFQTNLEVKIETINGATIDKKTTITPSDVDMLWEAYDTYVPPFYKGKANASAEGSVKVVAVPSNQNIIGFNYDWKQDDKNQQDSSGYGKNYYVYQNSFLENDNVIEVAVSDILGNDIGLGKITISPGNPKIIFYRKDQNLGTNWENALTDGFSINQAGDTIVAEPYFFSSKDLNSGALTFDWSLNGESTLIPNQKNILAIKPESGKSGTTAIKVIINNTRTLFQSITKEIDVNF